jgi:phosphatidylglycerophosphate synthase
MELGMQLSVTASRWNIPNALSVTRLVGVPVLVLLVEVEPVAWFIALYALLGLTDLLDGRLARAWGQTSEFGSVLDSIADGAYYIGTAYFAWRLFPAYVIPNLGWVAACLLLYAVLVVTTRLRLGRVLLPHTHLSRAAGVLAVAVFLASFAVDTTWPLRATILLYTAAFAEMILMVIVSREVGQDTRTILALRTRRPSPAPSAPR